MYTYWWLATRGWWMFPRLLWCLLIERHSSVKMQNTSASYERSWNGQDKDDRRLRGKEKRRRESKSCNKAWKLKWFISARAERKKLIVLSARYQLHVNYLARPLYRRLAYEAISRKRILVRWKSTKKKKKKKRKKRNVQCDDKLRSLQIDRESRTTNVLFGKQSNKVPRNFSRLFNGLLVASNWNRLMNYLLSLRP